MDFDTVKENIQPLRQGRNPERLGLALSAESQEAIQQELIQQRKAYELEIQNFEGDDPLELWYEYISWIEQSYPKSGKETHLDDVLIQCISVFEHEEKYQQDRRMIKIYMKYIDNQPNPQNLYQELYNQGIGTMIADLYIGWAYYYDAADNFKKAEEIYQKGLRARAQPLEDLEHAHKQFGFSMSQRILYKDEPGNEQLFRSSLEERRTALTSLRAHKKHRVGTTRTGLAIRSDRPGSILQENVSVSGRINSGVQVFKEQESEEVACSLPKNESIVQSLVDSNRTRENMCEPGPWSKAKHQDYHVPLIVQQPKLDFTILEDDTNFTPIPYTVKTYHLGFQHPVNFVAKNKLQTNDWHDVSLVIPEPLDPKGIPMYSKSYCYPGNGREYSAQEYHGYKWFKMRGISNKFTLNHDPLWDDSYEAGIRIPPNFAKQNILQDSEMEYDIPMQDEPEPGFQVDFNSLKIVDATTGQIQDKSPEEIMAETWSLNRKTNRYDIQMETDTLEETFIGERRFSVMPERQSNLSGRQSTLLGRPSLFQDKRATHTGVHHQESSDFKAPIVPGINRKSILPRKSIIPQTSNLLPIDDNSELFEVSVEKIMPYSTPFEIFSDEPEPSTSKSLGAIRKDSVLKRKIDTPDKMLPRKTVCAIDTPEKIGSSPTNNDDFDGFVVPKLPSPVKQKPFQIFEDVVNDSMCTMNFNQCLETGSMSTPIRLKEKRSIILREKPIETKETPFIPPSSPNDQENQENISAITPVSEQENVDLGQLPKQLSTIMETTETTSSSGLHTKSTIGSPDSDTDTEKISQNVKQTTQIQHRTVLETSMASLPALLIFEDKSENMRAMSLKEPSFNVGDDLRPTREAFSIFEDKTENLKAVTLQQSSLNFVNDTQIINKENNSRLLIAEPELESFKMSNESAFEQGISIKTLPIKENPIPVHEVSNSIQKMSIHQANEIIPCENSMLAMENIFENHENSLQIEKSTVKRVSDDFFDDFCKSPIKATNLSRLGDPQKVVSDSVTSKLVSFEVSNNKKDCLALGSTKNGSLMRKSPNFYDFFAKSPEKSSIMKFNSTDTRDTTEALLVLNLNDSKNISMMAKVQNPLIPESQIKQEKSLHIDRSSSFAKPSLPEALVVPYKKPIFAEDDNINTVNFASNLGSAQNSTFIATPDAPVFEIVDVEGAVGFTESIEEREKSGNMNKETRLSLSLDEDELTKQLSPVVQQDISRHVINEKHEEKVVETKCRTIQTKIPRLGILRDQKPEIISELTVETTEVDLGMSIYVPAQNTQDVDLQCDHWEEVQEDFDVHAENNEYLLSIIDLDATRAIINDHLLEEIINPFDKALTNALLDQIDFISYLRELKSCSLRNKICPLVKDKTVEFGNETFNVMKAIGKGAYGVVFIAKCGKTGQTMALKQERPANLWEYYICLEIRSRIVNPNVLGAFMNVEFALIGTNASILASDFSKFGTLIDVCNKVKKATNRNMDEYVVMHITSQILDLIDHLHSSQIIHADIKPDNFLLMSKINMENLSQPSIQLIDFGLAIDMQLLQNMHPYREVKFKLVADEDPCIEMRENKPWTYQVDLFGVAGTAHALLFGRYMEVHQKLMKWEIKSKLPRYFQKDIWETFFDKLLNIRSCKEMPNLQELRVLFKEELQSKDKIFREKVYEFNKILDAS